MSEYWGRLFLNVFKEFATCHVINSIVWYWPIEPQRPDVVLIVKTIPCWGRPISANARFAKQNAAPGNKRSWKSFRTMVWEDLKYRTVFLVAPCKQWLQWTNHPIERMEAGTTRAPQFARGVAPAAPTRNSPTCCVLCSSCEDDELIAVGVHSSLRKLSRLAAHAAHFPFRFLSRHGRPPPTTRTYLFGAALWCKGAGTNMASGETSASEILWMNSCMPGLQAWGSAPLLSGAPRGKGANQGRKARWRNRVLIAMVGHRLGACPAEMRCFAEWNSS